MDSLLQPPYAALQMHAHAEGNDLSVKERD
jgi:hypothetical protein